MKLRPYQSKLDAEINHAWAQGHRVVAGISPTGSGKTVLFAHIVKEHKGACCAIAHRQELVGQISLALAREGVRHRIIAQTKTIKMICQDHMSELGQGFYDPSSPIAVAGVDTLIKTKNIEAWCSQVTLWVQDECHHMLKGNKWGKAAAMFANAKGLGVTATPCRADGKGLGSHADGLIDTMVIGPSMRELITAGNLCEYKIYAPPSDIDLATVKVSTATGDFNDFDLRKAVRQSTIVGDVVDHYVRLASGKRGVTFTTDVETASQVSAKYNASGVPAEVISAKTPAQVRKSCIQRFARGEILQLVNVDLFGEGFDLPAIEVVSFARPTQSYALYVQQFGRALRPLEGKSKAIIIDHVGNVVRHGLPDADRDWSLDRRAKRARQTGADEVPLTACAKCLGVYLKLHRACPYCGDVLTPTDRSKPESVDGDLVELDAETLARMRGDSERIMGEPLVPQHLSQIAQAGCRNRHEERKVAQTSLRTSIGYWLGYRNAEKLTVSESYRLFYFRFGIDMLSAQALGRPDTLELATRINLDIGASHVTYAMGYQVGNTTGSDEGSAGDTGVQL